jgi:fibronectin type 3 domain-containing protein
MAPPTVASGRVYLASFGSENVGTGQFCVYGLLPIEGAPKLAAPSAVTASVAGNTLRLIWAAVPGARLYRVFRTSSNEQEEKMVALGLTTAAYTAPAPERGESSSYAIVAVAADGRVSAMSLAAMITSPKAKEKGH